MILRVRLAVVRGLASLTAMAVVASCGGSATLPEGARRYEAAGPLAREYSTSSAGVGVQGAPSLIAALTAGITAGTNGVEVTADARLANVATACLDRLGEGPALPPAEAVSFYAWNEGVPAPSPHVALVQASDAAALEAAVRDTVSGMLAREPANRFGAAVASRDGGAIAVIVLVRMRATFGSIAREQTLGSMITMRGSLDADLHEPILVITRADGTTARFPAGDATAFDVRDRLGVAGRTQIELLARGEAGPLVVANFPIWVGVAAERSVVVLASPRVDTADALEAELLARVRSARAECAGCAVLDDDPRLTEVARAHSRAMAETGRIAHESTAWGTPLDRVQRAGLRTGLVLENVARGAGAAEIHTSLLGSPAHRANIVNPNVTHVGIGAVRVETANEHAFVITEVFVQMARAIDPAAAAEQLLTELNRVRSLRRSRPLESDPNLARAAQEAATRFFAEPTITEADTVDGANAGLRRFAIAFERISGMMAVVQNVNDAASLEPALDGGARYVGLGVAQGTRADTHPNAIAVVIVLGYPRTTGRGRGR